MKKSFLAGSCLIITLMGGNMSVIPVNAAVDYWDPQGTTGAAGYNYTGSQSQTWENAKWTTAAGNKGSTSLANWVEGNDACFSVGAGKSTPAFTVTMNSNHTVTGIFDGNADPDAAKVTITGTGIMYVNNVAGFDVLGTTGDGSTAFVTINNVIAGTGTIVPENQAGAGASQIYLYGVNTYTGGTQLGYAGNSWNGLVNFNNNSSFGTGSIVVSNEAGSALVNPGTSQITITNSFFVGETTYLNIVPGSGGTTFSNLNLNLYNFGLGCGSGAGSNLTFAGVVSGSGSLDKWNSGNLILTGLNTYTGGTAITNGTLIIGGSGDLGNSGGNGSYAGAIVLVNSSGVHSSLVYNSTANQTLSGAISGPGTLTQIGSGTLTLNHAETYTGVTTVSGGILALGTSGSIGASAVTVASGATLSNATTTTRTIGGVTVLSSGGNAAFTTAGPATVGKISVTGNLTLNNNTITINGTGSALQAGTYRLMDCTGTLSGSANTTPTIAGTALGSGYGAAVSTTTGAAGHFDLTVYAPPVPGPFSLGAVDTMTSTVNVNKILALASTPNAGALSITNVSASNGAATVSGVTGSQILTYAPTGNYVGGDTITYTLQDGFATATGTINVTDSANGPGSNGITIVGTPTSAALQFFGIPGTAYYIQTSSPSATGPWTDLPGTPVTADSLGMINYTVNNPPSPSFYRTSTNP